MGPSRWQNLADSEQDATRVLGGEPALGFHEALDAATRLSETIAFGLRTNRGVPLALLEPWHAVVEEYVGEGFARRDGQRLRLTRKGKCVADTLAEAFVGG